jgi:hypothetical protein
VWPLLTHATEFWTVTKNDERRPSVFERKILRKIYGAICEKGQWYKRHNRELEDLYHVPNIVNVGLGGQVMYCEWMKTKYQRRYYAQILEVNEVGAGRNQD